MWRQGKITAGRFLSALQTIKMVVRNGSPYLYEEMFSFEQFHFYYRNKNHRHGRWSGGNVVDNIF
jgi:hypothetical protein